MLVLGILLLVIALVVLGFMYFGTEGLDPLEIDLGAFTAQLTPLHLYLLGAATLVVLCLGLLLLVTGLKRQRRRAKEVKVLREQVQHREPSTPQPRDRSTPPTGPRVTPAAPDRGAPPATGRGSHDLSPGTGTPGSSGTAPGAPPAPGPGAGPGAGPVGERRPDPRPDGRD